MKRNTTTRSILGLLACGALSAPATVVFSKIDLVNNTITVTNTSSAAVDLGGWRFCSHDIDDNFNYSSPSGFNGTSILAGGNFIVDTTTINFAGLLGSNAISIGLYNDLDGSLSFGAPDDLSAFIQFAPEGTTAFGVAEQRTATAVTAGLWDATGSFVELGANDTAIVLNDLNSATGAGSFSAIPEPSSTLLGGLAGLLAFTRRKRTS